MYSHSNYHNMQERYFDWRAPVKSKKAAEPFALVSGIGPKYGFNKLTVVPVTHNVLYDVTIGKLNSNKDIYITDSSNIIQPSIGSLITPDGLVTNFKEEVTLPLNVGGCITFTDHLGSYWEALLIASHLYVEDESLIINTSLSFVVNQASDSMVEHISPSAANPLGKNMVDWYNHEIAQGLEKSTSVIVGLYKIYTDASNFEAIIPYNYQWPQSTIIPTIQLNHLLSELAVAKASMVPKGTIMPWRGSRVEDLPMGWLYCGIWHIGTSSDGETIDRAQAYGSGQGNITISSMELLIGNLNNRHPGLNLVLENIHVTSNIYRYYVSFAGKQVNGVTIPDLADRVLANTGYLMGANQWYSPGQTFGSREVQLTVGQLPEHFHTMALNDTGSGAVLPEGGGIQASGQVANTSNVGGNQAHENRPPTYAIPFIIKVI